MSSLNDSTPEKSAWGYKGLIVALLIAGTFLGFFFLAVSSEPDYMPSQQKARQAEAQKQQQANSANTPPAVEEKQDNANPPAEPAKSETTDADKKSVPEDTTKPAQ